MGTSLPRHRCCLERWRWDFIGIAGRCAARAGRVCAVLFPDPERTIPSDPDLIISPADGRVMEVVEEARGGSPGRRISIFLSIFDVHVNRAPVAAESRPWSIARDAFTGPCAGARRRKTNKMLSTFPPGAGRLFSSRSRLGRSAHHVLEGGGGPRDSGERVGMIRFGSAWISGCRTG